MLKDCIRKLKLKAIEEKLSIMRLQIEQAKREKKDSLEERLIREYRDLIEQEKGVQGEANDDYEKKV